MIISLMFITGIVWLGLDSDAQAKEKKKDKKAKTETVATTEETVTAVEETAPAVEEAVVSSGDSTADAGSFDGGRELDENLREVVIKVDPRTIALPGNKVSRVPIQAARVRSTELRNLNEQYKAKKIERLYKLVGLKTVGQSDSVDLSQVFTREVKKEQEALDKEVIQVQDVFLIQFEVEPGASIQGLLNAYRELDEVLYIEEVVRTR